MSRSTTDIDFVVSKNTTNQLEKVLLEYKLNILRDLSKNLDVPFAKLQEQFIEKTSSYKNKYYGPDRSNIDEKKCMARVWHKQLGPVQCSRLIEAENIGNVGLDYCKTHSCEEKRRYGRIDEKLHTPNSN